MLKIFRQIISFPLLVVSITMIIWASLPNPHRSMAQPISFAHTTIASNSQAPISTKLEARQAVLQWPKSMRIGEQDEITLVFEPIGGEAPSPDFSADNVDIYSLYNIMAEVKFEVAGIKVSPATPTRESMPAGQRVKFKWEVSSGQVGSYTGQLWLSLRLLPLDGSQANQIPIFIHDVVLQSASLFGMTEAMAYLMGGAGVALGVIIVYSDMISQVRRFLIKNNTKVSK
jgi:hypothetical protein